MTCTSYTDELGEAAEAALATLSAADCTEIDTHRARLRQSPLPAPDNAIRRYRAQVPDLRPGLDGLYWCRTQHFVVFHAVDQQECRVLIAAIISEQRLDPF